MQGRQQIESRNTQHTTKPSSSEGHTLATHETEGLEYSHVLLLVILSGTIGVLHRGCFWHDRTPVAYLYVISHMLVHPLFLNVTGF